jgi:mannose-6-phosphate isomerase-like protein (cupin superfamily)
MKGYVDNIEKATLDNKNFRHVIYTGRYTQLVLMTIPAGGEIGAEVHGNDQFFRIEAGEGEVVIDGKTSKVSDDFAVIVPAGARHNVKNTGTEPLKLYTLYAPPHHKDGTIHKTKAEADKSDEEFDGKTSED